MLQSNWLSAAVLAVLMAMGSSMAHSQMTIPESPWYLGGSLGWVGATGDGVDDDADIATLYGRAGMFLNPNFSAEVRLGTGLGDDDITDNVFDGDLALDYFYGVYARGGLPVTEMFYPYAIVGYTWGRFDLSPFEDVDLGGTTTEHDVSYGVGADFNLSPRFTINVEYLQWLDRTAGELDGFSLGISSRF